MAQAILNTLSAYVDWASAQYVFDNNGLLLQMLCLMLQDASLQLPAAECLLIIANRKVRIVRNRKKMHPEPSMIL